MPPRTEFGWDLRAVDRDGPVRPQVVATEVVDVLADGLGRTDLTPGQRIAVRSRVALTEEAGDRCGRRGSVAVLRLLSQKATCPWHY